MLSPIQWKYFEIYFMNKMKSKLNITEFRNRMRENMKVGSPKFKLSPFGFFTMFGDNSKPFYGLITIQIFV